MTIEEIKSYLKKNKITYGELAEMSGVPIQTIQKIFCGITPNPRIDTMQAIEKALNIDGWTAEELAAGVIGTRKENITPIEDDLLYEFRKLSPNLQEFVLKMVRTLNGSDDDTPPAASMANRA